MSGKKLNTIGTHLANRNLNKNVKPKHSPITLQQQTKNLERKQFIERLIAVGFMLFMLIGICLLGMEFTNNKIESESWLKLVSGLGVCWFSLYGMKIILKIK